MSEVTDADALMRACPVIPVITLRRAADAAPLARALVRGGLTVLELTLRTPAALEGLRIMAEAVPEAVVGAGTVLGPAGVEAAVKAGARFLVSPGLTPSLGEAAQASGLPFLPGVATASELMAGLEAGFDRFKFFPAGPLGGPAAVSALAAPFPEARFCPTGGISLATAPAYLALPSVLCVGGGWVAPEDALLAGDFDRIERLAAEAAALGAGRAARAG